jgi:hypothetical protein
MAGPVNGVPWPAMAGLLPGGAAAASALRKGVDQNDPANFTGIIIPTVLQTAADVLNYWTSLTCLYDRYWTADPDKVTLPVCMFHVTKIQPVYTVETSKKRVILYEPQGDENLTAKQMADQLRENVMRSVIENSVKQPTTYTVEAIVPFQPVGRYITEGIKTVSDMIAGFSDLLGGSGFSNIWEGILSSVFSFMKTANTAVEFAGKLPGMDGVSYINMNSLEAMAESCRTLCMKMWTGYNYKFVQITNMTPSKDGKEDDVFRVTMTLQEKPVLAVSKPRNKTKHEVNKNWAVTAISAMQSAAVAPLIALTNVKNTAAGGSSGMSMVKKVLGV